LTGALLSRNPNGKNPFRLSRSQAVTCDQDHDYTDEQIAFNFGWMDKFLLHNRGTCNRAIADHRDDLVLGYYDGNTVTALWNYAQHFAMSDNFYGTTFGPSTPGAINLISGDTSGADPANLIGGSAGEQEVYSIEGSVIADPDPKYDECSSMKDANGKGQPTLRMTDGRRNVADLLNEKGVTWGWFQGGFGGEDPCNQGHISNYSGMWTRDYVPHHEPFQYYERTSNPRHLPPKLPIGFSDQAKHQYDLREFEGILDLKGSAASLPSVSFLKAPAYQDGHAGYSNPLDEQEFLIQTINKIQRSRFWSTTAVIVTYDDSDGWYDHQMGRIVKSSQTERDALNGQGECGDSGRGDQAPGRCGYGPRLPLLVVSPYAKRNFVDHSLSDQTSILKFIEDNWRLGQIGNLSYDAVAGSILNMFDFSRAHCSKLILDPRTGEPDRQK
ncbi:MAG TPA: alkaline phosphatase family protein, partial [Blastocatellia bacterium]|nr:alkaline phosphatase family protein [Blastocatellia bacterium]